MKNNSIDCLIIGFNDLNFNNYVTMIKQTGTSNGAYRDLNLAFIEYDGMFYRCLDLINKLHPEKSKTLHNADFLWPVITYLGSYLQKRGMTFDYINLFHLEQEKLKKKLIDTEIITIAITTTVYVSAYPILEIISFIKKYNRKAKIVVGGPFILSVFLGNDMKVVQSIFQYIGADFYVINSEGENALVNLIKALKSNQSLNKIDNIAYKTIDSVSYTITSQTRENNSLSEEMTDYTLFEPSQYNGTVSIRTSTSCPFSCAYCGFHKRAGKYKYMSVTSVEKELDAIRNIRGIKSLTINDDTFNVPLERFKDILRMMIKNKYNFNWTSQYRCDHGDAETIDLMRQAGCEGVFLGIESGNDNILKLMNKSAKTKDFMNAIHMLKKAGIWVHANFIVGFPGETQDTFNDTIRLIEESEPDTFRAQLWYADPITPIMLERERFGIQGSAFNWRHNTMNANVACDLIDKMFLSIKKSLWLPQNGFELWSVFYLQRVGMKQSSVKKLIEYFNILIRNKLLNQNEQTVSKILNSIKKVTASIKDV